jgi:hypothetical protein
MQPLLVNNNGEIEDGASVRDMQQCGVWSDVSRSSFECVDAIQPYERAAIYLFYISEIITVNLRCHLRACDAVGPSAGSRSEWLAPAVLQTLINLLVLACTVSWHRQRGIFSNLSLLSVASWAFLLLVNLVQACTEDPFKALQLALNFFGYAALIRFWLTASLIPPPSRFTDRSQRCCGRDVPVDLLGFGICHTLFTLSIIFCYFVEIKSCTQKLSSAEVIETQLEFFLLGYIGSIIAL